MRVLVTGATGFAGRWLVRDLEAAGHTTIPTPRRDELDLRDAQAVGAFVATTAPDAIAHLAGIAYGPDARRAPDDAFAVNAGGTRTILAAAEAIAPDLPVLVVSSSEVYGAPRALDLPIAESAPIRAEQPYGRSKVGLERAAADAAGRGVRRIAIGRPFNHTGPGQRLEFVVPALARRVIDAARDGRSTIAAGNVDVRRDFADVRDVARAYRLILEALARGELASGPQPRVYNIATGRSTPIREIATAFGALAGLDVGIEIDPALVRSDDPAEIRGDASRIATDLGWRPTIPLEDTLRDVFADVRARAPAPSRS